MVTVLLRVTSMRIVVSVALMRVDARLGAIRPRPYLWLPWLLWSPKEPSGCRKATRSCSRSRSESSTRCWYSAELELLEGKWRRLGSGAKADTVAARLGAENRVPRAAER